MQKQLICFKNIGCDYKFRRVVIYKLGLYGYGFFIGKKINIYQLSAFKGKYCFASQSENIKFYLC